MASSAAYQAFLANYGKGNPVPVALSNYNGWVAAGSPSGASSSGLMPTTTYGGALTSTNTELPKLAQQFGIDPSMWQPAMDAYLQHTGNTANDQQWWGDEATKRAYIQGLGYLNPTQYGDLWNQYSANPNYNPSLETTQQNATATTGNTTQAAGGDNWLDSALPILAIAGMGAIPALFGGAAGFGGAAAEAGAGAGALGSGTFGLDLGAGAAGNLGSLGIGATGAGGVAAGGGALGTGLAGLGAADLGAAGLGGLAGAGAVTGATAGTGASGGTSLGDLTSLPSGPSGLDVPGGTNAVNAGGTTGGTGANNVSWLDDLLNNTGGNFDTGGLQASDQSAIDFANQLNDVSGLPSGPSGLDVPGGVDAVNAGGTSGGQGFWDQAKSLLSQGKNIPTSLIKSVFGTDDATSASIASMIGKLGAAGLGAYASNQQSNALADVAKQYAGYGAPYRDQLAQLQSNPGSFLTSPRVTSSVDQGTSALARALSVKNGNPIGSGNALQELQNYSTNNLYGQLTNRENQLANFGGLSSFNAAAPQTGLASVQAQGNTYNAIGAGLNDVLNPQPTYLDIIKAMKGGLA